MSPSDPKTGGLVPRYTPAERVTHWIVAIAFVLLATSGLAFFHPAFWPLVSVTGGGAWSRILHPYLGLVMFVAFAFMAAWYWRDNVIRDHDRAWGRRLGDIVNNRLDGLPEIGKYNLGQKQLFWSLVVSMLLLGASGVAMWHELVVLPPALVRVAAVVHALAAFVLFLGIIVHFYSAVFWVRGSMRAMTRGNVTRGWAKHHHPLWYREVAGREPER